MLNPTVLTGAALKAHIVRHALPKPPLCSGVSHSRPEHLINLLTPQAGGGARPASSVRGRHLTILECPAAESPDGRSNDQVGHPLWSRPPPGRASAPLPEPRSLPGDVLRGAGAGSP